MYETILGDHTKPGANPKHGPGETIKIFIYYILPDFSGVWAKTPSL